MSFVLIFLPVFLSSKVLHSKTKTLSVHRHDSDLTRILEEIHTELTENEKILDLQNNIYGLDMNMLPRELLKYLKINENARSYKTVDNFHLMLNLL
jgi:hypothetical protein